MGLERITSDGLRWGSLSFLGHFGELSPQITEGKSAGGAGGDSEAVTERETGQRRARAGACSLFSEACDMLLMEKKLQFLFCGNSFVPHEFLKRALLPLQSPAGTWCWLGGAAL